MPVEDDNEKTPSFSVLSKGTRVGHYLIIEKIGAGGMGEVYLAEDTELSRKVALKLLPSHLCQDADCRARFKREAQAVAKISHPNIITIFEVSEFKSRPFFAMEYIEGESLADFIKKRGTSIDRIIELSVMICDGLNKAHQAGIIHRDIKPSNILIDQDGRARILDFGLAAIKGDKKLTKTGSTLGTVNYMSPEQTRGESLDHRSDIFSLGVVLYEMVAGQLPFKGEHEPGVIYSIQYEEPEPLARYKSGTPYELQRIVTKALAKDKDQRFQHADDLAADLKRLGHQSDEPHLARPKHAKRHWIRLVAGGAVVLAVFVSIALLFLQNRTVPPITRRQVSFIGRLQCPQISPDGKWLSYIDQVSDSLMHLCIADLAGSEPLVVYTADNITWLRWAPDGSMILFGSRNGSEDGTYEIHPMGGSVRRVLGPLTYGGYLSGGNLIAGTRLEPKQIIIYDKLNQKLSTFVPPGQFQWLMEIDGSPKDGWLVYTTLSEDGNRLSIINSDGTGHADLISDSLELSCPRWANTGRAIYYFRPNGPARDLMRVNLSQSRRSLVGKPVVVQSGLLAGAQFSVSADGRLLAYCQEQIFSNYWLTDISQRSNDRFNTHPLTSGTSLVLGASISPDGTLIAYSKGSSTESNIFVVSADGTKTRQITSMRSWNVIPRWSPDGSRIAFASLQGNQSHVWHVSADGGVPREFVGTPVSASGYNLAWAPCNYILYQTPGNRNYIVYDARSGVGHPLITNDSVGWMFFPVSSPDCKYVAVYWNRWPQVGLWTISRDGKEQKLLAAGTTWPLRWSRDGQRVYGLKVGCVAILAFPANGGEPDTLYVPPARESEIECMSQDETKYVYRVQERTSDAWIIEHFDPEIEK